MVYFLSFWSIIVLRVCIWSSKPLEKIWSQFGRKWKWMFEVRSLTFERPGEVFERSASERTGKGVRMVNVRTVGLGCSNGWVRTNEQWFERKCSNGWTVVRTKSFERTTVVRTTYWGLIEIEFMFCTILELYWCRKKFKKKRVLGRI